MTKVRDENDLLLDGNLPEDPEDDCEEVDVSKVERERPTHTIHEGDGHKAVQFSIDQLAKDDRVYQRGLELVTVTVSSKLKPRKAERKERREGFKRADGAPVIGRITGARLWTWLQQISIFKEWNMRRKQEAACNPPREVISGVLAASGEWGGVRPLVGISTTPIISGDGSIRMEPGYDPASGLYFQPDCEPPEIPKNPTRDDAMTSVSMLLDVVADFPFASEVDKAGWLAALLTPLARPLCPTVPMFIFDANTSGSGKSLLCEAIGRIVSGRPMACGPYVSENAELRKRIIVHAMNGDTLVLIDNAPNGKSIGWPSLDLALTATEITDRILQESRTVIVANTMTWFLTGNNLGVERDMSRRAARIRLESPLEHPERRASSEFTNPELPEWVSSKRRELLGSSLIVLSAYLRAGRPASGLSPLGSFVQWSRIVRDSIIWAGSEDVSRLIAAADDEADPEAGAHVQLLEALLEYPEGLTAAGMIEAVAGEYCQDDDLRDALTELAPGRSGVGDVRKVGFSLRRLRGGVRTISGGRGARLVRIGRSEGSKSKKSVRWGIETTTPGGVWRVGGVCQSHVGAGLTSDAPDIKDRGGAAPAGSPDTPFTPHTPQGGEDTPFSDFENPEACR